MVEYFRAWRGLRTDRRAVTALEYGLIAGLIVATISVGFSYLVAPQRPDQKLTPAGPGMGPGIGPGGMQGAPGMMDGNTAGIMAMMQMMRGGLMMPMGIGSNAAQPFQHIEGQLAYWRAELHITDTQRPQWDEFAAAVRDNVGKLRPAMTTAMQSTSELTAPDQLDRRLAFVSAELDAMRAIQAAAKRFYEALSADQKKEADQLMAEHMIGLRARGL
jgi:Flp pilus assembly pilin Flp